MFTASLQLFGRQEISLNKTKDFFLKIGFQVVSGEARRIRLHQADYALMKNNWKYVIYTFKKEKTLTICVGGIKKRI